MNENLMIRLLGFFLIKTEKFQRVHYLKVEGDIKALMQLLKCKFRRLQNVLEPQQITQSINIVFQFDLECFDNL